MFSCKSRRSPVSVLLACVGLLALPAASATASPQTSWAPVGAQPQSEAQAAAQVTRQPETRSGNVQANNYVPSDSELSTFRSAKNQYGQTPSQYNPLNQYVTGRPGISNPSTDDLIQWTAHKWGIPEDWVRAEMVHESYWRHSGVGDRRTVGSTAYYQHPAQARIPNTYDVYESLGITQVKWRPDGSQGTGTEPLRWKSTAFNLDYYAAQVRYYYDGRCSWCGSGYGAGQGWASIGAWFSPSPWNNSGSQSYQRTVQDKLNQRTWAQPGFSDTGSSGGSTSGGSTGTTTEVEKATGKPASASSVERSALTAGKAVDGDGSTRFGSTWSDNQWWQVDLGRSRAVSKVTINWEAAYCSSYAIRLSQDGSSWSTPATVSISSSGSKTTTFSAQSGRYVRVSCLKRATQYGMSFWTFQAYGASD